MNISDLLLRRQGCIWYFSLHLYFCIYFFASLPRPLHRTHICSYSVWQAEPPTHLPALWIYHLLSIARVCTHFPKSRQSNKDSLVVLVVWVWRLSLAGLREGCWTRGKVRKSRVWMDTSGVKVTSCCAVRWHCVREDDPFADTNFLHHQHHPQCTPLSPLPLLAFTPSDWLVWPSTSWMQASSHPQVTGSIWKEAGTSSRVQHCMMMYEERGGRCSLLTQNQLKPNQISTLLKV